MDYYFGWWLNWKRVQDVADLINRKAWMRSFRNQANETRIERAAVFWSVPQSHHSYWGSSDKKMVRHASLHQLQLESGMLFARCQSNVTKPHPHSPDERGIAVFFYLIPIGGFKAWQNKVFGKQPNPRVWSLLTIVTNHFTNSFLNCLKTDWLCLGELHQGQETSTHFIQYLSSN